MKSKYKKVLIIPYFGKIPAYLDLWMVSCSYNDDYTFLIYTDLDLRNIYHPKNVVFKYIQFNEIWERLSKILGTSVYSSKPYKLCDLRPAYGEIFYNDIKDFDFWGYCDTDLIFGNIYNSLPDRILDRYKKIFNLGHFTLYKNTEEMNSLYRDNLQQFITIISTDKAMHFDEGPYPGLIPMYEEKKLYASLVYDKTYNINHICWNKKIDIYTNFDAIADVHAYHDNIQLSYASSYTYKDPQKKNSVFIWKEGTLTRLFLKNGNIASKEYMYIHLQKRKMQNMTHGIVDGFLITNHAFKDYCTITPCFLRKSNINNITLKKYLYIKKNKWQVIIRQKIAKIKLNTGIDLMKMINKKGIQLFNE